MHYRWKTGMLAWVLFRITGLALVAYIAMHIMVISSLHDPAKFDKTMVFLGSWKFRLLEIGLFAVVLYHSLNGVRIFIIDFFDGSTKQAKLFWGLAVAGLILFAAGTYPMLHHALYWKDKEQGRATLATAGVGSISAAESGCCAAEAKPAVVASSDACDNCPDKEASHD